MELNLRPAFFWPNNRTTVRLLKFSATLGARRLLQSTLWRLMPERAVNRAVRQMLTPSRQPFPKIELAKLEEASLISLPWVTRRLVAWRWGRRIDPVVVLVHGWGGRGTQLAGFVQPLLERGFSVVTYDAPGHGMTGGKESSLPHMLSALDAVLNHLGTVHAIIGHSFGGALATMAMAQRPDIKCGVLIAPPASLGDSSVRLAGAMGWSEEMRATVQKRIESRFGIRWADFEAEGASGNQPMLVIHDQRDKEVPIDEGRRHARQWSRGHMLETEGLGHRRILNDDAVINSVTNFVSGAGS